MQFAVGVAALLALCLEAGAEPITALAKIDPPQQLLSSLALRVEDAIQGLATPAFRRTEMFFEDAELFDPGASMPRSPGPILPEDESAPPSIDPEAVARVAAPLLTGAALAVIAAQGRRTRRRMRRAMRRSGGRRVVRRMMAC